MGVEINLYDFMNDCIGFDLRKAEEHLTFDYKHVTEPGEEPKFNMGFLEFVKLCQDVITGKNDLWDSSKYSATDMVIAANKKRTDVIGTLITLHMTKIIKLLDEKLKYVAKKRSKLFRKKMAFIESIDIDNMVLNIGGDNALEILMLFILGNGEREVNLEEDRKIYNTINQHAKKMFVQLNVKYIFLKEEKESLKIADVNSEIEHILYNDRRFEVNEKLLEVAFEMNYSYLTVDDFENDGERYMKFVEERALKNGLDINEEKEKWLNNVKNIKEERLGNKLKPKLKIMENAFNKLNIDNRRK